MSIERRAENVQMAEDLAEIKTLLKVHLEGENGLTGRVKSLEGGARVNFWMTYVGTPALIIGSHIARGIGFKH